MRDLQAELNNKFNIDSLREQKEAELQTYVDQLNTYKTEIDTSQSKAQTFSTAKAELEEQKTEVSSTLKLKQKDLKKRKEVFKEIQKLQGQDL